MKKKKLFYVVGAGAMLPMLNFHLNGIINKADGILDDDEGKIGKYFLNINTKILRLKNFNLKNSFCLIGCIASAKSTRKIISILNEKKTEIILTPTLTF